MALSARGIFNISAHQLEQDFREKEKHIEKLLPILHALSQIHMIIKGEIWNRMGVFVVKEAEEDMNSNKGVEYKMLDNFGFNLKTKPIGFEACDLNFEEDCRENLQKLIIEIYKENLMVFKAENGKIKLTSIWNQLHELNQLYLTNVSLKTLNKYCEEHKVIIENYINNDFKGYYSKFSSSYKHQ
jgi:hypothetical protein